MNYVWYEDEVISNFGIMGKDGLIRDLSDGAHYGSVTYDPSREKWFWATTGANSQGYVSTKQEAKQLMETAVRKLNKERGVIE